MRDPHLTDPSNSATCCFYEKGTAEWSLPEAQMGESVSSSGIRFKSHINAGPLHGQRRCQAVYGDIREHWEADKGGITAVDHTGAGNGTSNYFKRSFLRKQVFENNK